MGIPGIFYIIAKIGSIQLNLKYDSFDTKSVNLYTSKKRKAQVTNKNDILSFRYTLNYTDTRNSVKSIRYQDKR